MDPIALFGTGAQIITGLLDRHFGQQQHDKGIEELRRLQAPGGPIDQQKAIAGGTGALGLGALTGDTSFIQGIPGLEDEAKANFERLFAGGGFQAAKGQYEGLQGPNTRALAESEGGRIVGDTKKAEGDRQKDLTKRVDQSTADAQARFQQSVGAINTISQTASTNARKIVENATRRFDELGSFLKGGLSNLEGKSTEAIQAYSGEALAATEEAVAGADSDLSSEMQQIAQLEGQVPPQVMESMKAQARQRRNQGVMSTLRAARAADSKNLAEIRTNFAGIIGQAQTNVGSILQAAGTSLSQTEGDAAAFEANVGMAGEQLKGALGRDLTDVEQRAASLIDSGQQFANSLITATEQSNLNNIMTAALNDANFDKNLADTLAGLDVDAAMAATSQINTAAQLAIGATVHDMNVSGQIAAAHFGWEQTILPFSNISSDAFAIYQNARSARIAEQQAAAQSGGGSFSILGSGGSW